MFTFLQTIHDCWNNVICCLKVKHCIDGNSKIRLWLIYRAHPLSSVISIGTIQTCIHLFQKRYPITIDF